MVGVSCWSGRASRFWVAVVSTRWEDGRILSVVDACSEFLVWRTKAEMKWNRWTPGELYTFLPCELASHEQSEARGSHVEGIVYPLSEEFMPRPCIPVGSETRLLTVSDTLDLKLRPQFLELKAKNLRSSITRSSNHWPRLRPRYAATFPSRPS